MTLDTSDYFTEPMFVEPTNPERFDSENDTHGGRLPEKHPNLYPTSPDPHEAWLKVAAATNLLTRWRNAGPDLHPSALADMVRAHELVDDLTWHIPRVYGFVCRYKVMFGSMTRAHYSEFSAHESMVDAIRWAMEWERQLPRGDGDGSTGPWEIVWAPARVNLFRAFGADPAKFIRTL